jgi:hypothetical protein
MDRENIALTVGGVLATMALAYLFYRKQQSDTAASAAAQADAIAAEDSAPASDPYNTNLTQEWLASSLTNASGAALTGLSSNTPASIATSGAVSDLGASYDSTDTAHMLSDIVAHYSGAPSSSFDLSAFDVGSFGSAAAFNVGSAGSLTPGPPSTLSAITVPAIAGVTQTATGNIPVSAADAIAQAELALSPSSSSSIYAPIDTAAPGTFDPAHPPAQDNPVYYALNSFLASMQSGPLVSSHHVDAHPIVSSGV